MLIGHWSAALAVENLDLQRLRICCHGRGEDQNQSRGLEETVHALEAVASVARLRRSKAWVALVMTESGVSSSSWAISRMPGVSGGSVATCLAMLFQSMVPLPGQR